MTKTQKLTFLELAHKYCERQEQTITGLKDILLSQVNEFEPDGWMLLECHVMDSTQLGQYTILPYGPNNTFESILNHPISPRGLASDMSVVVGYLESKDLE